LFFLTFTVGVRAQEDCPWLTVGTAAALMRGDATETVHVAAGEGTCDFWRKARGEPKEPAEENDLHLRIEVKPLPPKECTTGENLIGVGEDAVLCIMAVGGKQQEIVRGRVRKTYFLLTLTAMKATPVNRISLSSIIKQAAEEVAGNLF